MNKQYLFNFIKLLAMVGFANPAYADITSRLSTSVQLTVDGAATQASRIGSTYAVSGNNISLSTAGGLSELSSGSAVGYTPASYGVINTGDAFSFTESFIEGDATPSSIAVTDGTVSSFPLLGQNTTASGGVAGSLAGTIRSSGVVDVTAGGAGTTAIGQFVSELTID